MTVYLTKLDKAVLDTILPDERSLFLSLAHLANEIRALQKLFLWSNNFTSNNDAETKGQTTLSLMIVKLLAGKLNEGHKLLKVGYFDLPIEFDYQVNISSEAKDAIANIRLYFNNRNNVIRNVRNRQAFHYSPRDVDKMLPNLSEDLELYIQKDGSANNLYYFAEVLADRALLHSINPQDQQAAMQDLMEDVRKAAHWFTVACDSLLNAFVRRHVDTIWEGNAIEIIFDDLRPFSTVQIPWFTDTSGLTIEAA
jgi:hypothetical protein